MTAAIVTSTPSAPALAGIQLADRLATLGERHAWASRFRAASYLIPRYRPGSGRTR
jgi:hypothetical protein